MLVTSIFFFFNKDLYLLDKLHFINIEYRLDIFHLQNGLDLEESNNLCMRNGSCPYLDIKFIGLKLSVKLCCLGLSKATNLIPFQTERLCR